MLRWNFDIIGLEDDDFAPYEWTHFNGVIPKRAVKSNNFIVIAGIFGKEKVIGFYDTLVRKAYVYKNSYVHEIPIN